MKPKSVSLLAILIAVTAFGSAFTSKQQKKKLLEVYAVWGVYQEQVWNPYFDPPSVYNLNCSVSETLYLSLSSLQYSGYSNLEQFRQQYDNGYLLCTSNSDYVCMAYVSYDIGTLTNGVVIDLIEGDYLHIYDE